MNSTLTASAAIRAHGSEAGAIQDAKRPKYHLRAGPLYLHWSAMFLTDIRKDAWKDTAERARACRAKFDAAAGCKLRAIETIQHHSEAMS